MLVPATAEDLKKHGQISIIAKTNEEEGSATEVADPKEGRWPLWEILCVRLWPSGIQSQASKCLKNRLRLAVVQKYSFALVIFLDFPYALAKPMGTTVQIKIPVVATVIQRRGEDGNMCMMVQSPGPSPEGSASDTYIFNSTENEDMMDQSEGSGVATFFFCSTGVVAENSMEVGGGDAVDNVVSGTQIEYLDEAGNIITEEQFSTTDTCW